MSDSLRPSVGKASNAPPECLTTKGGKVVLSDDKIKANIVEARFRTGWPKLVPQPTISRHSSNPNYYITQYEQKVPTFRTILQAQGVFFTSIRLVERKSAGSQSSYPTLLIEASSRSGSWYNAVLELVTALQTTVGVIHVEIVEEGFDEPRILPIRADDSILLGNWRKLRMSVAQNLSRFQVRWKLLSLVKLACRDHGDNTNRPAATTVLVEAWDADADTWELNILPDLKSLARKAGIEDVEIWQAQGHAVGNDINIDVTGLPERTWEKPLRIGDGLAPQGTPSIGTLGGFVCIEDPAEKESTNCVLTSCQAVKSCPGLTDQIARESPEKALQALNITNAPLSYTLQSPADPDMKRKIKLLEQEIQVAKQGMYGHDLPPGAAPALVDRAERGDERAVGELQVAQQLIDKLEAQVRHLSDATNFVAGAVRAASGFQFLLKDGDKKVALDWALVQVASGRPVNLNFPVDNQKQASLFLPTWTRHKFDFHCWRKLSQSKPTDVLKVGRATGWTRGEINYAEAWLNLSKEADQGSIWEQEYGTVVECMRIENPRRQIQPFSIGGDSGSMVLDARDGACLGLLFGGHRGGTYGLMTPIEDIFSSVEKVTGCRVVKPQLIA